MDLNIISCRILLNERHDSRLCAIHCGTTHIVLLLMTHSGSKTHIFWCVSLAEATMESTLSLQRIAIIFSWNKEHANPLRSCNFSQVSRPFDPFTAIRFSLKKEPSTLKGEQLLGQIVCCQCVRVLQWIYNRVRALIHTF